MTDADPRVQAARDALMAEGDDGGTSTITWHRGHYERTDGGGTPRMYALPAENVLTVTGPLAALVMPLIDAVTAWLDQGQMDRDERLLTAAREIKALREAR